MSEFVTSKRRESYLVHISCPVGESVKWELLVAPGTDNLLFNQPLLEKVVSTIKEDSLSLSTASLASISKAASRGPSGSGGYASPLDFSRQKKILRSRASSMTLADLEKLDQAS